MARRARTTPPPRPTADEPAETPAEAPAEPPSSVPAGTPPSDPEPSWHDWVQTNPNEEVITRFKRDADALMLRHPGVASYCTVVLLDSEGMLGSLHADIIYGALLRQIPKRDRDVLLVLLSPGGSIEPAYQIAKLCKTFAKNRFVVAVPRQAKSAATLVSIGADEIHMGPLSQLGPVDPQLGGLPALGVQQALQTLAAIVQKYPASGEMFASYLREVLTVEQIGYCERIGESAVQYSERLLSGKPFLAERAASIARELVYEYKHHGFVIDYNEAQAHLGSEWVRTDTPEAAYANELYTLYDLVALFLNVLKQKRLMVVGEPNRAIILDRPKGRGTV